MSIRKKNINKRDLAILRLCRRLGRDISWRRAVAYYTRRGAFPAWVYFQGIPAKGIASLRNKT